MGKRRRPARKIETNSVAVSSTLIDAVEIKPEPLDDPEINCEVNNSHLTEEFEAASEPETRAVSVEFEEASDELGVDESEIRLHDIMQPFVHYFCVQSIAFTGNFASSGVTIKCLVGCKFERRYDSFNALRDDVNQHFLNEHADNMYWNGFCTKCQRYVPSSKLVKRQLTVADEIEHIKNHMKVKQKKVPAAK